MRVPEQENGVLSGRPVDMERAKYGSDTGGFLI